MDAISFPAVPLESGRLRIQLNAGHRREDIDQLVDILERNQNLAAPARRLVAASANGKRRPAALALSKAAATASLAALE